jgi:hypothetical protein
MNLLTIKELMWLRSRSKLWSTLLTVKNLFQIALLSPTPLPDGCIDLGCAVYIMLGVFQDMLPRYILIHYPRG